MTPEEMHAIVKDHADADDAKHELLLQLLAPLGDRPDNKYRLVLMSLREHVRRTKYEHQRILDAINDHIRPTDVGAAQRRWVEPHEGDGV